jgi:Uma2 family endonuclease
LALRLSRQTSDDIFVISEPQFNLDDDTYLNPDILVHPASIQTPKVRGGDALLVVEIADSSLRYDLSTKALIYAAYGVLEYWVINAVTLATMVHRKPSGKAYESMDEVTPGNTLIPLLVPAFSVSLDALQIQFD